MYLQVKWHDSKVPFHKRFDKYLDPNFFQHRVCIHYSEQCVKLVEDTILAEKIVKTALF